jgi:C1A family cysteine protease
VGALESLLLKERLEKGAAKFVDLSRLFVYYYARKIGGYPVSEDSGSQIRDAFKALAKYGTCAEEDWPYIEHLFDDEPGTKAKALAKRRKILAYYRLDANGPPSAAAIEGCVVKGYNVEFGFSVPDDFVEAVGKKGIMRMPTQSTRYDGGHAVLIVGYDRSKRLFEVRNSWGGDWGDNGYFWAPYEFVLSGKWSDDFWFCSRQMLG